MYTSLAKENQGHVGSIQEVQGCIDSIKLHDRPNFSSLQVCDQLRTSFEPDSVMEFGLKQATVRTSRWLIRVRNSFVGEQTIATS